MGSSSTARSPATQVRALGEQGAEPVELLGDLFGLVEHERGVEPGRVTIVGECLGQREKHREAALHVRGAEAVQRVRFPARGLVAVRGNGVEVAGEHDPAVAAELGPRDDVVAEAFDRELRRALPQAALDQVGDLGLVVTHRRDRTELLGQVEQIQPGHVRFSLVTC